jgi:TetR/AcrR family transcriptional regulator, transcriptional repressor for nem operon
MEIDLARTLKNHDARRAEIVEAALRLVYTRGYEQMAIQDILDMLQISKGAFYHYFNSKQALLEDIIERLSLEAIHVIAPIVEDPTLPALEKLERMFAVAERWKTDRKEMFFSLLSVWYADDNAIVRQKVYNVGLKYLTPYLTQIIQQGLREGVLSTPFPDRVAEVIMGLMLPMADRMALLILDPPPGALEEVNVVLAVYNDTVERVLGAPAGSLHLVDLDTMKEWLEISNQRKVSEDLARSHSNG